MWRWSTGTEGTEGVCHEQWKVASQGRDDTVVEEGSQEPGESSAECQRSEPKASVRGQML